MKRPYGKSKRISTSPDPCRNNPENPFLRDQGPVEVPQRSPRLALLAGTARCSIGRVRGLVGFTGWNGVEPGAASGAERIDAASCCRLFPMKSAPSKQNAHKGTLRACAPVAFSKSVAAGADRFITNNSSDFTKTISEVTITYPDELPET